MIEEIMGAILGLLILLDIFLLILYARTNKTIYSTILFHSAWRELVWLSRPYYPVEALLMISRDRKEHFSSYGLEITFSA